METNNLTNSLENLGNYILDDIDAETLKNHKIKITVKYPENLIIKKTYYLSLNKLKKILNELDNGNKE